jgi:hypothetical protein
MKQISTRFFLFQALLALVLALLFFEVYCRFNSARFPSYGWVGDNVLTEKIDECKKANGNKPVIAVFGDSFVEYYGNRKNNLVELLNHYSIDGGYCNFGSSGSGFSVYSARFKEVLNSSLNVKSALFFIYEGNDFSEFLLNNLEKSNVSDRKLPIFFNIIKKSYALNFIYRQIIKYNFFNEAINPSLVSKELNFRENNINRALSIYSDTPQNILKLFESDILNKSWYKVALAQPDYFDRIHTPSKSEYELQKLITFAHINYINQISRNLPVQYMIIPVDVLSFDKSKAEWAEYFRFYKINNTGRLSISNELNSKFKNFHYADGLLEYENFIRLDGHLTEIGNQKLAHITLDFIK